MNKQYRHQRLFTIVKNHTVTLFPDAKNIPMSDRTFWEILKGEQHSTHEHCLITHDKKKLFNQVNSIYYCVLMKVKNNESYKTVHFPLQPFNFQIKS